MESVVLSARRCDGSGSSVELSTHPGTGLLDSSGSSPTNPRSGSGPIRVHESCMFRTIAMGPAPMGPGKTPPPFNITYDFHYDLPYNLPYNTTVQTGSGHTYDPPFAEDPREGVNFIYDPPFYHPLAPTRGGQHAGAANPPDVSGYPAQLDDSDFNILYQTLVSPILSNPPTLSVDMWHNSTTMISPTVRGATSVGATEQARTKE